MRMGRGVGGKMEGFLAVEKEPARSRGGVFTFRSWMKTELQGITPASGFVGLDAEVVTSSVYRQRAREGRKVSKEYNNWKNAVGQGALLVV